MKTTLLFVLILVSAASCGLVFEVQHQPPAVAVTVTLTAPA